MRASCLERISIFFCNETGASCCYGIVPRY
nr:MAG TPA: hypothetical protein [Caudoviricetes sp.]DAY61818.1 MAG TPA: hypothetical protein [Caudoviricetes sp.]